MAEQVPLPPGYSITWSGQFEYLERAVELSPGDSTLNDHLGDAYWFVGRKAEARFQWERAYNYAEDEKLKATITEKLVKGPAPRDPIREAGNGKKH